MLQAALGVASMAGGMGGGGGGPASSSQTFGDITGPSIGSRGRMKTEHMAIAALTAIALVGLGIAGYKAWKKG